MTWRRTRGFTLLEMSIVLLVLSVFLGGALARIAQETRMRKQHELSVKLEAIERALVAIGIANRRLPCPADGSAPLDSPDFGGETGPEGACTSGSPAGTFSDGANTVSGVVPVRAIGLPDEYMFDSWGGRFTYVVDKRITTVGSFDLYWPDGWPIEGVRDETTRIGDIEVVDHFVEGGVNTVTIWTEHAVAAIVSHGENGHGAFQVSGVRKSAGSRNSDEHQNCHCDSSGEATPFDGTVTMEASRINPSEAVPNSFDDVVRFFSRASFLSASDRLTENQQ